ncbi:MAG: endonuclease III [Candidatus Aenigmarchaeota archaeon]|nr:endonuclease III [Candidatus Aenigmarchaeota archaeon]
MTKRKMDTIIKFLKENYDEIIKEIMDKNIDLFEMLVTTILSQRTTDENTYFASERLFSVVTTPEEILDLDDEQLEDLIKSSGTFRRKAKRIKEVSKILIEKYPKTFPKEREELMNLPGVGPKTADVVLSYGMGKPVIAVDVHVEVCSKRLGLVRKEAKYEEIRKTLEDLVPEDQRYLVNLGFVKFGKNICRTRYPKCSDCKLIDICNFPSSGKQLKTPCK